MNRLLGFEDGCAILGEFPAPDLLGFLRSHMGGQVPLSILDFPYGGIVKEKWDVCNNDVMFASWMIACTKAVERLSLDGAALYVWGGVGKVRCRPFFRWLVDVEHETHFQVSTPITWRKRRGYGIPWGYLFTREELAYCVLGDIRRPRKFNIPLLDKKRGYAGYDPKYPAKSEYLRRTNVWDDVTEILRGKVHVTQKPQRLHEIPIEVHTDPGEWVFDPFAGSGTTALAARKLGRRWLVIEKDPQTFDEMVERIRGAT